MAETQLQARAVEGQPGDPRVLVESPIAAVFSRSRRSPLLAPYLIRGLGRFGPAKD